jgi:hypothetical protein
LAADGVTKQIPRRDSARCPREEVAITIQLTNAMMARIRMSQMIIPNGQKPPLLQPIMP